MGIIRPKGKFIELFEAEKEFCNKGLSETEQINHQKSIFSDLLDIQQFANIYNRMVISTYIIWYKISTKWDVNNYKEILRGETK